MNGVLHVKHRDASKKHGYSPKKGTCRTKMQVWLIVLNRIYTEFEMLYTQEHEQRRSPVGPAAGGAQGGRLSFSPFRLPEEMGANIRIRGE